MNFLLGFLVGALAASGGWIAFMLHIANKSSAKVGE